MNHIYFSKLILILIITQISSTNSKLLENTRKLQSKYSEIHLVIQGSGTQDLVSSSASATKGQIDLGFLPVGIYYLVETYAPDGYIRRTDPVIITVTKTSVTYDDGTNLSQSGGISQIGATYQLKVTNDEGAVLPSTGGPGTRLFTILGTILIAGAGLLMWRKRRVS